MAYFQPAVHLTFSILIIERTTTFSLSTLFERNESPFNLDLTETDFSNLFTESDVMAKVGFRVVFSVFAYLAVFLLTIFVFIFCALARLPRFHLLLISSAVLLYAAAGLVLRSVPPLANQILSDAISRLLGFFAAFINTSQVISLSYGWGYKVTLTALIFLLITEIVWIRGCRNESKRNVVQP